MISPRTTSQISRRITFFLGQDGLPLWRLNRLKTLAGYFRSVTVFCNLSQRKSASVEQPIHIMSLSSLPGDLCQLLIEGNDAELASMLLTDFAAENGVLISGGKRAMCKSPQELVPLPFKYHFHRFDDQHHQQQNQHQHKNTDVDKHGLLAAFSLMVADSEQHAKTTQEALFNAMYKRECVSSTCMGHGIALPHIMTPLVTEVHLFVASTQVPIDWGSQRGDVTRVIGVMLPMPAVREHIVAFSGFSQQLLHKTFCGYLTENLQIDIIETIVLHALASQPRT